MKKHPMKARLLLILASAALAGCSALPQTSANSIHRANQRMEFRTLSETDMALIRAQAAESAEAASHIKTTTSAGGGN